MLCTFNPLSFMKKSISVVLILFSLFSFSQENTVPPGDYRAISSNSQGIKLTISENNKFQLTVFKGTFEKENDTIYFHSENENKPNFEVEYVYSKSDKIKVSFDKSIGSDYQTTYFGSQKINDSEPKYETLKQLLNIKTRDYIKSKREDFSFEMDKSAFIFLAEKNVVGSTSVEKYEIPNGVSEIKIRKTGSIFSSVKLKGYYDTEKLEFIISEGKNPITFIKENPDLDSKNLIQPLERQEKFGWYFPGKEDEYDGYDAVVDTAYADYVEEVDAYKPAYSYKHTIAKNYTEALKSIEKSTKFLVVSFDNQKDAERSFDTFISESELDISNNMYDGYNPKIDRFHFYRATDKDKNLLSKYKISDNPVLLFFNPNGDLIYHTSGTLNQNEEMFNTYYSVYANLELANQKLQLDTLFATKKTTLSEVKTCLKDIVNLDYINLQDNDEYVGYDGEVVVEDVVPNLRFQLIEDTENLYSMKTTKDKVLAKWNEIVDLYTKNKTYDADFAAIAKGEISKQGFSRKLFDDKVLLFSDTDFLLLDYLFNHYSTQIKEESQAKNTYNYNTIGSVLETAFENNLSEYSNPKRIGIDKVMNYYSQYNKISNYKLRNIELYINSLKESKQGSTDYLVEYDRYFDSQLGSNKSIIESLDAIFNEEEDFNWQAFKESFARFANTMAWDVVEANITDKKMIESAIKWSEASLKAKANDPYYLDTLGQLYYRNGEKERGITTEEKAAEAMKSVDETEYKNYLVVIEKMKNGTY
jgi:hypothetical protein